MSSRLFRKSWYQRPTVSAPPLQAPRQTQSSHLRTCSLSPHQKLGRDPSQQFLNQLLQPQPPLRFFTGTCKLPSEVEAEWVFPPSNTVNALLKWAELLTHLSDLQEHPLCTWKRCSFWQFYFDSQVEVVHKWQFHCKWHHKQHIQWHKTIEEIFFKKLQ